MDAAVQFAVSAPRVPASPVRHASSSTRSVPASATACAVSKRTPVHGALHSFNDVTSQFAAKEGGSRRRRQSTISAVADFGSESSTEESGSNSNGGVNWRHAALATGGAAVAMSGRALLALIGGDGGGFGGFGSGGGGGGGGGGDGWRFWLDNGFAWAKDEGDDASDPHGLQVGRNVPVNRLNPAKRYRISEVELVDKRTKQPIDAKDAFYELVTLRNGGIATKAQLDTETENLMNCGMFQSVEMEAVTKIDGSLKLQISFTESQWQPADSFRCVNVGLLAQTRGPEPDEKLSDQQREELAKSQEEDYKNRLRKSRPCMLPKSVEREISGWLRGETRVTARMLQRIRDRVQKWYHDEGYACAQVVNFGNLNTNEVVCEVVEGDITQLQIQFQDRLGFPSIGHTQKKIIQRELPEQLKAGQIFNIEAGKKALRNINSLALFSNIEVNPRPDEENDGGIVVEVKLKELEQRTAEVSTEWSIVPGSGGRPTLSTIQPAGSVTFEHRNIQGLNRSILGVVTSNNLFNPQDDLGFKAEYVHPYVDGIDDPRNRTFRASCFNSRKLSAVFTGGPGMEEVPSVWIDRAGFKANLTESFTRQSKFTYGLVCEEVTTRDETSSICVNGARTLPSGALSMDGPPTTHSDTGIDRVAFLQANLTHDNTQFVNGTPIGERHIFQVDQGLGVGSNFPFFNRHQVQVTRFIQLQPEDKINIENPPPVGVLHARYAGCVGDLASYDAFTLGGPYSVRGYNMGELGAARNLLELAAELRIPIKTTHTYGFVEYGTDLGSSKDVRGNPTEFFRRKGNGASYGVGVKLGSIRAEYARDCNAGKGAIFLRFGERF
ncbi:hypothetical protein M758_9G156800 [Ceratodon purpureus]|nr:hypothetical protein M758_9G156800 [Ceratodon purpureus]